jgi:hypothetical protein
MTTTPLTIPPTTAPILLLLDLSNSPGTAVCVVVGVGTTAKVPVSPAATSTLSVCCGYDRVISNSRRDRHANYAPPTWNARTGSQVPFWKYLLSVGCHRRGWQKEQLLTVTLRKAHSGTMVPSGMRRANLGTMHRRQENKVQKKVGCVGKQTLSEGPLQCSCATTVPIYHRWRNIRVRTARAKQGRERTRTTWHLDKHHKRSSMSRRPCCTCICPNHHQDQLAPCRNRRGSRGGS